MCEASTPLRMRQKRYALPGRSQGTGGDRGHKDDIDVHLSRSQSIAQRLRSRSLQINCDEEGRAFFISLPYTFGSTQQSLVVGEDALHWQRVQHPFADPSLQPIGQE